jgi:hypothetical protein
MPPWNYAQWAEAHALQNFNHRLATADLLLHQSNQLLTLLLTGVGGSMVFAANVFGGHATPFEWSAAAVAAWLALVAVILTRNCIATTTTPVAGNEPDNIYKPELGLTEPQIRAYQMANVQESINAFKVRNARVAIWLDRARYAAAATPVVFSLVAGLALAL